MEILWYLSSIFHVSSEKEVNEDDSLLQTGRSALFCHYTTPRISPVVHMRQFHSNSEDQCVMQKKLRGILLGQWRPQEGATGWDVLHISYGKDS